MRVLVIDDNYPADDNLYGDVFAHVRVKEYLKHFNDVKVVASLGIEKPDYIFDGVRVTCAGSVDNLYKLIVSYKPDRILIHFASFPIINKIILKYPCKYIIWVHGAEALGWYRRLFNLKNGLVSFSRYIAANTIQILTFRKLIKFSNKRNDISFVFVSEWMKRITEADCQIKVRNSYIVPNPINDTLFFPEEKSPELRKKILMIRPFYSKKYGTDIVTKAMLILKDKDFFKDLEFTIYGKGAKHSKMNKYFSNYSNVGIFDKFLSQAEIKEKHSSNGVFLSITRQDAQGVSMCEAMSSGLLTISSDNTAIPEYVHDNYSGVLINNKPYQLAEKIEQIYKNPEFFQQISRQGSKSIIEKAGLHNVIEKELDIIKLGND